MRPRVTVIVPARNEERAIDACLRAIRSQTEVRLQIIVVDGDSDDDTRAVVRRHIAEDPRVELLENPRRTVPYSLNIALAEAKADLLVRVDAHATVPPGYVDHAAELLELGTWGAVGGVKRGIGRTPAGEAVAAAMASRFGVGGSVYHYGARPQEVEHVPFGAYPTALAREIGGWDPNFTVNQDFEFDHRIRVSGHRILFHPDLQIEWECRQSIGALFRQYRRYGRGKVKVMIRHPKSTKVRHLVPPAFVAYLVVLGAGATMPGARRWAGLGATPYLLGLVGASVATAREVDAQSARGYLPAAFLAMHVGWGVGFWEGVVEHVRARQA